MTVAEIKANGVVAHELPAGYLDAGVFFGAGSAVDVPQNIHLANILGAVCGVYLYNLWVVFRGQRTDNR